MTIADTRPDDVDGTIVQDFSFLVLALTQGAGRDSIAPGLYENTSLSGRLTAPDLVPNVQAPALRCVCGGCNVL